MFRTLLRKELAEQVLSGRLLIALALFLILLPLSSILLLEEKERQIEGIRPYEQEAQRARAWLGQQSDPNRRFQGFAFMGVMVPRRPPELSFLAQGFDPVMPRLVHAETKGRSYFMTTVETSKPSRIELDNAIRSIFPVPDTVYLVTTIGALLSIFLSFDAVCREREEGTLKLLFANPVRRGTVVLAKWLAALLSVGLPLVVATLVVVVYVVCSGALVLTVDPLWRWAMLTFLGLLYLAFFCAVGVLISTVVSTRRVSLLLGLAVWLLLVLVAPGIAAVAVRRAVPMPAKPRVKILWQEYSDAIRGTSNGPLLDYVEGVVPEEQENLRLIQVQERKAEEQRELFKVIARTTPTASYVLAGAELAGAGSTYYDAFCRADQRLANEFQTFVLEHRQEAKAGALTPEEVDLAKFPEFTGLSVSAHATLKAVMGDMGLLALEAAGVLLASVFLFVRSAEL